MSPQIERRPDPADWTVNTEPSSPDPLTAEEERMPNLTPNEIAALDALPKHGSQFEIGGAIGRDRAVRDLFNEQGAYDRRILLVTLRSALGLPSAPDHRPGERRKLHGWTSTGCLCGHPWSAPALADPLNEIRIVAAIMRGDPKTISYSGRLDRAMHRITAVLSEATLGSEPALDVERLRTAYRNVATKPVDLDIEGDLDMDEDEWMAHAVAAEYRRLSASQTPEPDIK